MRLAIIIAAVICAGSLTCATAPTSAVVPTWPNPPYMTPLIASDGTVIPASVANGAPIDWMDCSYVRYFPGRDAWEHTRQDDPSQPAGVFARASEVLLKR